jgi:peptidyl-prolyl cis-trans isomerase SurA
VIGLVLSCTSAARADVIECVVAFVGDEPIFLSEVRERALQMDVTGDPTSPEVRTTYTDLLARMIDDVLVAREAERLDVEVTDDDVARAIESVRADNGLSPEEMEQAIVAQGWSRADYEAELRRQLLKLKVVNLRMADVPPLSDREVHRLFEERFAGVSSARRYRLSHIAFLFANGAERESARARAEGVLSELRSGTLAFDAAVTREGGAHSGWLEESAIAEGLRAEIEHTPDGEITGVIEIEGAFQILLIHARASAGPARFEEHEAALRAELEQRRVERAAARIMEELRRAVYVEERLPEAFEL